MEIEVHLPRTTESPVRQRGDEPRSNSVMRKRCVPYPARLERGECSGLPAREAPQSHGRKPVVRGLLTVKGVMWTGVDSPPRQTTAILTPARRNPAQRIRPRSGVPSLTP